MLKSYKTKRLHVKDGRFRLDGQPYYLQGVSFFNALFNDAFNRSEEDRRAWLAKFKAYGVNCLRVWCQWDLNPKVKTFIDVHPDHTLYTEDGQVKDLYFERLAALLAEADALDMTVEVALFVVERYEHPIAPFPLWAHERAAAEMTRRLLPYRNLILQIWNENSVHVPILYETIKRIDYARIVTNSPGYADSVYRGTHEHNDLVDVLTPHTNRSEDEFYKAAVLELEMLMEKYRKPVIDDEPARNGTLKFGGREGTTPQMHIEQIRSVRALGAYHIYHHDMFQLGYGDPSIPPSGIPDPEFSPYHRQVFEWLKAHPTW
ncbi:hypothetical protein FE782_16245 [Paenibacillus antri]|uniref:Glycoside hydrolase family 5 domain-containing protein n=1 Tax=Paenibacillus antri TaxID=2582848 RepID=A0A5R9G878_9BACL|nr:hypothetical protein [Paenibacillus antri]TLS51279.1 hypothetical protein FE782_16245 [Paenibacillus antri]